MKILIIRFSSFGDIVQAMSCLEDLHQAYRELEVHWLVRNDLSEVVGFDPRVKVIPFDRKLGFSGLWNLAKNLRNERFDAVYDAHFSLRSRILRWMIKPLPFIGPRWVVRSKERIKRFFLFKLRLNFFPRPYKGMNSYREPLKKLGIRPGLLTKPQWNIPQVSHDPQAIILCPSAAWEMKRWPINHWIKLIALLPQQRFLVLGGPTDSFCQSIADSAPERCLNLAGKVSLKDSCAIVARAPLVISADTGLIHVADLLGVKGLSLMGPTAFGFCTNPHIETLEIDLKCRPCTKDGRGSCSQSLYQKCMVEITPEHVSQKAIEMLTR
ncbi:MAG: glycosyl transferase 9 [Bdellovibrio sp. CG12_big_fil_rev_8_21_14_0_65_39_13]|nr:MAG: glycosyl transferase 9 [Bdellovibrio sp. CG22_combo_CG10-13_8_21_14_all_39_27]PIQ61170.1 MAG: glycosyl transferase 9 [Bdellovibrio sp. CG12_big_fil_rev_8_21_14_0_65_39_13]PIR34841.1 MAG: glycosyl transferase 9 [Bdellovibrio sp. CG11_big_fil_rev_8_21_14_0_20_39_38]